jgi:hypothetical protein
MVSSISNVFSTEDLNYILNLPEVLKSKILIDRKTTGIIYFNINLTTSIKNSINEKLDLDLSNINTIPMRWIKGDTSSHVDTGATPFDNTYLIYLTNSLGEFVVDNQNYPITQNNAYIFNEGLDHKTINTGSESRLLVGPMDENGSIVGAAGAYIQADGGTTIYIKQEDTILKYSYDNQTFNDLNFPCFVTNTNTSLGFLKIVFITNIIFNNIDNYFYITSSYIQFGSENLLEDGARPEIIIDNVTDYVGLINNSFSNNIYIFNLYVNAINSTLSNGNGWIGIGYFGYNVTDNYIINCHSNGPISNYGGGIVGSHAASTSGILTIIGCSSTGNISLGGGGICGQAAGQTNGTITCQSCWSSGIINEDGGGIFGDNSGEFNGTITVTNCYSTGLISGNNSGGIMGYNTGVTSGNIVINNCYSTGNINNNAGGIIGSLNNEYIDNITITNCYTTGNINASNNAGGIVGIIVYSPSVNVANCYVSGTTNDTKGYIFGNDNTVPVTCYSEAYNSGTGWNSTNANTVLTGIPSTGYVGTIWISTTGGTGPYELKNMGYTPYDVNNILGSPPNLVRTETLTVTKTTPSITGLKITDVFYAIVEILEEQNGITINAETGAINTTTSTASGTYTLYIYNTGSYNITLLSLIVEDIPCLTEDTHVLTPNGYINIKQLCKGDNVITCDNRIVKIVNIYKSLIVGNDKSYPCIIPKNSIANNYPLETFKISQGHLIKHNKCWIYPRLYFKLDKSQKIIKYYHIKLENYITDNLVINNGVVVESLGNYPSDIPNIEYIKESKLRLRKKYLKFKPLLL